MNGLDESYAVAFNDVDFCVRVREAGYTNVFTPFAQLYHYESKSRGTEDNPEKQKRFQGEELAIKNDADAISHATCALSMDVAASLIVVCTRSGQTARMVSRFRPPVFIIGMTTDVGVWHKLALSWGVLPVLSEEFTSSDVMFYHALLAAKKSGLTKPGDRVVITGGVINGKSGNTNQIKLETI